MPGETIVIVAGVLVSFGMLELPETLTIAVVGAIIGDNVGYLLGRRLGRPWLERHGRLVGMHGGMLRRVDELFARHGGKAVLVGRCIGFLRAMAPRAAGAACMPWLRSAPFNAIGATAWGSSSSCSATSSARAGTSRSGGSAAAVSSSARSR